MEQDPAKRVGAAMERSDLVHTVASIRSDGGLAFAINKESLRALTPVEIHNLEELDNCSGDWSRIRVVSAFDYRRVRGCTFQGDNVLGHFRGEAELAPGVAVPTGLTNSLIVDCVIGDDVLIHEVKLLARAVIGPRAILLDCGRIVCEEEAAFGNGFDLKLAVETGGREVPVHAEMDVALAATVAMNRSRPAMLATHRRAVSDYVAAVRLNRIVIGPKGRVLHTPLVADSFIGSHAVVDSATVVKSCTLLSSEEEKTIIESRACVMGSILQWGAAIRTLAIVENSVLTEHSSVERHGKVLSSLLGPGTHVAEGEVANSLVGPLVGFHHQALLISALWPEGKGNVSHGANVGSNHTSRAPDQEFWPGEGAFFGLGVNIKYPADFSQAPFTLVATGTTTLPQKLAFPFSLVTPASTVWPDVPPAFNELLPGWLLSDNRYALKRNEKKYRDRYPGRRLPLEAEIFRPEIVDLMRQALHRLESIDPVKDVYADKDIEGLGKNCLVDSSRRRGAAAYRFQMQLYALLGLKNRIQALLNQGGNLSSLLVMPGQPSRWEHERQIILEEFPGADLVTCLRQLPGMLEKAACEVEASRSKDDERGRHIIDDYADCHVPAADDPVVKACWRETRRLQEETERILERLSRSSTLRVG